MTVRQNNTTKRRAIRTLEERRAGDPGVTTRRFRLLFRQGEWQPEGEIALRRTWPSRLDRKQEVLDAIAHLLLARGWVADTDRSWLMLCLDEAVTNAMLHGNEGDPGLPIAVTVVADARRWHVGIADRGDGFAMGAVPDPDDPATLTLEHGRGIRLMRAWLGTLAYWQGGATVVLSRRRADIG